MYFLFFIEVDKYIAERQRQISIINLFYQETLSKNVPQIGKYANGDIPSALLTKKNVFVMLVPILPDLEKDCFNSFFINPSKPWYNDEQKVGEIRYVFFTY